MVSRRAFDKMININEVLETNKMIEKENLDVEIIVHDRLGYIKDIHLVLRQICTHPGNDADRIFSHMIEKENLDVRTITLGISLLDCIDSDLERLNEKIYNKITTVAKDLVATGEAIENPHQSHRIHIDTCLGRSQIDRTAHQFCLRQRLRDRAQQQLVRPCHI